DPERVWIVQRWAFGAAASDDAKHGATLRRIRRPLRDDEKPPERKQRSPIRFWRIDLEIALSHFCLERGALVALKCLQERPKAGAGHPCIDRLLATEHVEIFGGPDIERRTQRHQRMGVAQPFDKSRIVLVRAFEPFAPGACLDGGAHLGVAGAIEILW